MPPHLQHPDQQQDAQRRDVEDFLGHAIRRDVQLHDLPVEIDAQLFGRTAKVQVVDKQRAVFVAEFDPRAVEQLHQGYAGALPAGVVEIGVAADVVAGEPSRCHVLSRESFDVIERDHAALHSALMRNILLMNLQRLRGGGAGGSFADRRD